jgi:hypothetical protein
VIAVRADSTAWRITPTMPRGLEGVVSPEAAGHLENLLDRVGPTHERVGGALAAGVLQALLGEVANVLVPMKWRRRSPSRCSRVDPSGR